MATRTPPEGYDSVTLARPAIRRARKHAGGSWRAPIHGTYVFAADDGAVLAVVRTLGHRLPEVQRRYSLRVEGVLFTRIVPLISAKRPINSDIAAYDTPEKAMEAGSDLIARLREEDDDGDAV